MSARFGPLVQLTELGQSVWCDQLSREMIDSKKLVGLIADYGVTGLTTNPSIFQKALSSGDAYDLQIARSAHRGHTVRKFTRKLPRATSRPSRMPCAPSTNPPRPPTVT